MLYIWKLDKEIKDAEKILNKIKPSLKLRFDIGIVKYLNNAELEDFHKKFLRLISALRKKTIEIDYDDIRIQSIKYSRLLIGPKIINLEIISKCNYTCQFCRIHGPFGENENIGSPNNIMPFNIISTIIEQAYALGTETIIISGDGEPLMHPQILDIISYVSEYNLKLIIFTNASIYKTVSKIIKLPINSGLSFLINMSAVSPEKYNEVYGQNANNFFKVLGLIKDLNRKFSIGLNYIIMKSNFNDIEEFIRLAKSLGIRSLRFKFPTSDYEGYKSILLSDNEQKVLLNNINKILRFSKHYNIKVSYEEVLQFFRRKIYKTEINNCYNGWYFSKIDMYNNMYNCCFCNELIEKVISGNFMRAYFSESSLNRCLEGKKQIDLNSTHWRRCKIYTKCIYQRFS